MPTDHNKKLAHKPSAEPLIPLAWEVPQEFRDRLGDDVGRQRLMECEGHLLLVLHAPPTPETEHDERAGRFYWRNPKGGWKPNGLTRNDHALRELLAEYEQAIDILDEQVEAQPTARVCLATLQHLGPLLRSLHNLYGVLEQARQARKKDRQLILLRDEAYALSRQAELLHSDVQHTLDFTVAHRAEEQAEFAHRQSNAAYRLNVLVALFFPIATLGTIFGMNLSSGLEDWSAKHAPLPMLLVLVGGLALGAILSAFVTRK